MTTRVMEILRIQNKDKKYYLGQEQSVPSVLPSNPLSLQEVCLNLQEWIRGDRQLTNWTLLRLFIPSVEECYFLNKAYKKCLSKRDSSFLLNLWIYVNYHSPNYARLWEINKK